MKITDLYTDDRGVSPVVGVALLIAIAVILAAVIGAVVLGLGTGGVDTPQAQQQADFDAGGDLEVELSHQGGEPLPADEVVIIATDNLSNTDDAELHEWTTELGEEEDLTAGKSVTLDAADIAGEIDGETDPNRVVEFTVVWEDPNSDSETVLEEFSD